MAYQKQTWENLPSQTTPLSADRLNHMEGGIYDNSTGVEGIVETINRFYQVVGLDEDTYDATKTYSPDDIDNLVIYNHGIYECIQESTGNLPTDTNYWELVPIIEKTEDE